MKLCVIIPAYNEASTISKVIKSIPKKIKGISNIVKLVVDDGSTDNTVKIAKTAGADIVISHKMNLGLGEAFKSGIEKAIEMDADIIVNIDADNQYDAGEIPALIKPILGREADIVLGSRFEGKIEKMALSKKVGNILFSLLIRKLSGLPITDSQTGFRAFSREAAIKMNILSNYTYTQEMIIQAANKNLKIIEIPCTFMARNGNSRLIQSIWKYAKSCFLITLRTYRDYKPLKFFGSVGMLFVVSGLVSGSYIMYNFLTTGKISPHMPLTILTAILILFGLQIMIFAFIADMISNTRKITEKLLYETRKRRK